MANTIETNCITPAAYVASLIAKANPGQLLTITGYNSGAAQFLQVHDSATLPADAAVPKLTFAIAATANFTFSFVPASVPFRSGITICNSSTGPTKTIGSANCWIAALVQ